MSGLNRVYHMHNIMSGAFPNEARVTRFAKPVHSRGDALCSPSSLVLALSRDSQDFPPSTHGLAKPSIVGAMPCARPRPLCSHTTVLVPCPLTRLSSPCHGP